MASKYLLALSYILFLWLGFDELLAQPTKLRIHETHFDRIESIILHSFNKQSHISAYPGAFAACHTRNTKFLCVTSTDMSRFTEINGDVGINNLAVWDDPWVPDAIVSGGTAGANGLVGKLGE